MDEKWTQNVYEFLLNVHSVCVLHKEEFLNYFLYPYVILSIVVYFAFGKIRSFNYRRITSTIHKKILFVVAHPDDECMFLSPSIISLVADEHVVELLCLTTGNMNYGVTIRESEALILSNIHNGRSE